MKTATIKRAAALGALSGMRSMMGLTTLSTRIRTSRSRPRTRRFLSNKIVRRVLPALAIGELAADKLPLMPDRTAPVPLTRRTLLGGFVGGVLASEDHAPVLLGAGIGAVAAVAASFLAVRARKYANERWSIPNAVVGGLEDTLALSLAARSV
jgi:uncharacterized membrane protein